MCVTLARGFRLCPRCCNAAWWCHGFGWLPGFATQEHQPASLAGGPPLPCSLIRQALCSPTWPQELASQLVCLLIPLSCRPRGLQSIFPFRGGVCINQGTKTARMSVQWLQLCLVSLWGAERDYFVMSSVHSKSTSVTWGCAALSLFFICLMVQLSWAHFFFFFPYPFHATPTK